MFFHTTKEKQMSQIFGITDALGVTLINRDHPFPLLVEEEERMHGAFIVNTSHGALFRALGCMSDVPNTSIPFKFTQQNSISLPPLLLMNTVKFLRDQMALDAVQCHEGFAKHISYAFQFQRSYPAERHALKERLLKDRKVYKLLNALCERFIDPAIEGAYELASSLGYHAAKAVLNTTDLHEILNSPSAKELWYRLQTGRFASDLDVRTAVAIKALEDFISEKWSNVEITHMQANSSVGYYEVIAGRLREAGFDTLELKDPVWLVSQTALLGKRIEALSDGVYCSEMALFLGWKFEKDKQVEIDPRYLSKSGEILSCNVYLTWLSVLSSDPALRVFYPPKDSGTNWTIGHNEALLAAKWNKLAIYVTPAFEETGQLVQVKNTDSQSVSLLVNLYCFGLTNEGPKSVLVPHVNWWEEQEKFADFPDNSLVFVTLEPFIPGPTVSVAPVEELAEYLGIHAPVVYWKMIAGPNLLTDDATVIYAPNSANKNHNSPDRGECAVINRRSNHATLTCAPKYVVEIVKKSALRLSDNDGIKERARRTLQPINAQDRRDMGAKLAYDLMYEQLVLPRQLPYFSGLELFHYLKSGV